MGEVVPHATAPLHELHLLLVDFHDAAIGVAVAAIANDKAVGERHHLEVVADARHGTSLGDDILEVFQQPVYRLLRHRVGVVLFDTGKLGSQTVMHHVGIQLVNLVIVPQGVLVHPHVGGKLVAIEILHGGTHNVIGRVLGVTLRLNMLTLSTEIQKHIRLHILCFFVSFPIPNIYRIRAAPNRNAKLHNCFIMVQIELSTTTPKLHSSL